MPACTFFGHKDCPESVIPKLRSVIRDLITIHGVDMFYVGNHGRFDTFVRTELSTITKEFPHIRYAVVLAYMPCEKNKYDDYSDTMLPEGIESIHPRYAISWRNNWMLKQADYVVAYVARAWGGAAQYVRKAQTSKKHVCNLYYFAGATQEDIATS